MDSEVASTLPDYKWTMDADGYVMGHRTNPSTRKTEIVPLHRFINGTPKGLRTDHKNGFPTDNTRRNLRNATCHQNAMARHRKTGTTSVYKGVSWAKHVGMWFACIKYPKGKTKSLGYWMHEIDAARAYNEAAEKYHGEFAVLNQL